MKSVLNVHWKDRCRSWSSNTFTTWWEEPTHWKRPWCWERLKVGGEGDDRGWDGWMASPTQWTWVWVSSGSWWWTGRPGLLQSRGSQRIRHDWSTELNQTHSHNIPLKITRAVRRFLLRRRNMSLRKIHCCYIIIQLRYVIQSLAQSLSKHIPLSRWVVLLCNHQLQA